MRFSKMSNCAVAIAGVVFVGAASTQAQLCEVDELHKLTASDAAAGDEFGQSVSISGNVAILGAWSDDDAGTNSGSAYVYRYDGVTWQQEQEITAANPGASDHFGASVSIDGNVAVVGAPDDDAGGFPRGSAYVFRYNGASWQQEAKLTASDAGNFDQFGVSVSIAGEVLIVGAWRYDTALCGTSDVPCQEDEDCPLYPDESCSDVGSNSGAAYVFRYNGASWVEEEQLTASDAAAGDFFAYSVSLSGNVALVGAYGDRTGSASGSAYLFRYNGASWLEEEKLLAWDAPLGDEFGYAVSISGDTVLAGARYDLVSVCSDTLGPCDDDSDCTLGSCVPGPGNCHTNTDCAEGYCNGGAVCGVQGGSAYAFRYNGATWDAEQKLSASDLANGDEFGLSVSISGNLASVGAHRDDDACPGDPEDPDCDSGSAYIFRFNGTSWEQQAKLTASDAAAGDEFGVSVSITEDAAFVGAYRDDNAENDSGSAYVFSVDDCNRNGIADECDLAGMVSDDCNANNILDECEVADLFAAASEQLSPIGTGSPRTFIVPLPPEAATDVTLDFDAIADLNTTAEWIDVDINGIPVGSVFVSGAGDCPAIPNTDQLVVPMATYNVIVAGGDAAITMVGTVNVNPDFCTKPSSYIAVSIDYGVAPLDDDCNENEVPDDCDIADLTSDDYDVNGVPDECEDCDADGAPNGCELNCGTGNCVSDPAGCGGSENCNFNETPDECEPGSAEDCNGNFEPDLCDIYTGYSFDCNGNAVPDECETLCAVDQDCDDGDECTADTCDCWNPLAGLDGCVNEYQQRPYGDVSPFGSIVPPCPADPHGALGDGFANMLDVFCAFNAFNEGFPYTLCPCGDVSPCGGDSFVNMLDVFVIFAAFNESPECPAQCP